MQLLLSKVTFLKNMEFKFLKTVLTKVEKIIPSKTILSKF